MKDEGGQLLLEVLIALTVLGLVIVAVAKISTISLVGSRVSGDNKTALDFAKQVLVNVEKDKTSDVQMFFAGINGTEDCSNSDYECLVTYVFDTPPDSESVTVGVLVTWDEGKVELNKVFTKTRL